MADSRIPPDDPRDDQPLRGDARVRDERVDPDDDAFADLPSPERGREQARARSGDPDANEMGTAATARPTADTHGQTPAEREAAFQQLRRNPDPNESTTDDVRGAYDRYTSGELLDGTQVHNEPPGRTE